MNHKNVLRIEGVAPDLFPCCTVSRWMGNGNMLEYLNRNQGEIDRLELVSADPDRLSSRCDLIVMNFSYEASSMV